jgi:hypothetical protein
MAHNKILSFHTAVYAITDETFKYHYSCNVAFAWKSTPQLQARERNLKILRERIEARVDCAKRCSAATLAPSFVILLVYNLISLVNTLVNNDAALATITQACISDPKIAITDPS